MAESAPTSFDPVTVAVAADVEAEPIRRRLRDSRSPSRRKRPSPSPGPELIVAGVGRAGDPVLERLLASDSGTVLNVGLAGALTADLEPGAIVVTSGWVDPSAPHDRIVDPDAGATRWLRETLRHRGLDVRTGTGITVDEPFHRPADRDRLHRACGALTVEMEGARWARLARRASRAFAAVRVISDRADLQLPRARHLLLDGRGGVRWGRWLGSLGAGWARLPRELGRLLRARSDWIAALESLDTVAAALVDALTSRADPPDGTPA